MSVTWNLVADHADAIEDVVSVLGANARGAGRLDEGVAATVAQLAAAACSEVTDMVEAKTPEARVRAVRRARRSLLDALRALEQLS